MLRRLAGAGLATTLVAVSVVAASLVASSGGLASAAPAAPAAAPGWRVSKVITLPKLVTLLTVDPVSKRDAWAGGCAATRIQQPGPGGPVPTRPLIEHFGGKSWHRVATPRGLGGCIGYIRSSGPGNVWAFGWNVTPKFVTSAFALRLARGHWTVAKRWGPKTIGSYLPIGAAVLSKSSVWVFFNNNLVEHYNGRSWRKTAVPGESFLQAVSTDSRGGVWVVTEGSEDVDHLQVVDGKAHWSSTSISGAIPSSGSVTGIYARTPTDVWVVGSSQVTRHGKTVFHPVAAHFTAGAWHSVGVHGILALAEATSDGHGGIWLRRDWDNTGVPPAILHYARGVLRTIRMPVRAGQRAGILDIARIPGTDSAWAVGAFMNNGALGASTGLIMKDGP
jgi:hypothetical protein